MLKVVSFPDFGCGGILCALLNNQKFNIIQSGNLKYTDNESHNFLKIGSHLTPFDSDKLQYCIKSTFEENYSKL